MYSKVKLSLYVYDFWPEKFLLYVLLLWLVLLYVVVLPISDGLPPLWKGLHKIIQVLSLLKYCANMILQTSLLLFFKTNGIASFHQVFSKLLQWFKKKDFLPQKLPSVIFFAKNLADRDLASRQCKFVCMLLRAGPHTVKIWRRCNVKNFKIVVIFWPSLCSSQKRLQKRF